jgi:broad specificity phosphatase PhoE
MEPQMEHQRIPRALPISILLLLAAGQGCGHIGRPDVIYIARHGQTEWNRQFRFQGDPDLDPVGYVNRASLWMLLKERPIHSIYTSELLRTRRTAELVALQHKLPVQTRAALNEIDVGVVKGICYSHLEPDKADPRAQTCRVKARGSRPEATLKALRPLFHKWWGDRMDGKAPLGQNFREVVQQTTSFVEELGRGLKGREILVVGHSVVNRALLHHLLGWSVAAVAGLRHENDQVYRVEGASTGSPRVSLYTPGAGWRPCRTAPRPGDRHLDCSPQESRPEPSEPPPLPSPPDEAEEPDAPPSTQPASDLST